MRGSSIEVPCAALLSLAAGCISLVVVLCLRPLSTLAVREIVPCQSSANLSTATGQRGPLTTGSTAALRTPLPSPGPSVGTPLPGPGPSVKPPLPTPGPSGAASVRLRPGCTPKAPSDEMWNSCTLNSISTSMCMDTSPDPERHPVVTFGTTGSCRTDMCIRLRPRNVTIIHPARDTNTFPDRKCGTAEMVSLAAPLIYKDGWPMKTKQEAILTLKLDDVGICGVSLAYVLTCGSNVRPIPDATFWGRPDTFYPNYTKVALELQELSRTPPKVQKCLWAGNPDVHPKRGKFVQAAKKLTDVIDLHLVHGPWGMTRSGRKTGMTLTKQMEWACMVDVQGGGYSGRIPLLLWSGRPLLVVRRDKHADLDQTFYFVGDVPEKPQPWVHYVPVSEDFHDLAANAKWILQPENAERLRQNAMAYAAKYLTLDFAVQYMAKEILKVMKKQDVEKKPR